MKISIIIPMYNVELYIEQCLLSCLKQDIACTDYEIIVVDDGSPDGSLKIAKKIARTVHNIRIISQINGGLSTARNTGFLYAKGNYLWFVDSDDRIRENCLKQIIKQCEQDNLDLLAIGAANTINGNEIRRFSYSDLSIVRGVNILEKGIIQHCVPFTIYKRSFFLKHQLKFYPGIFHEDSEFSPRAYFHAERVGFTNDILYLVTINPNSITRTVNYKKSLDCLKVAESIDNFYKKNAHGKLDSFFHNYISLMINNSISNFSIPVKDKISMEKAKNEFLKEIYSKKDLFQHLCKSSLLKYRIEGFLFTLFPHHTIEIYHLLQKFNK